MIIDPGVLFGGIYVADLFKAVILLMLVFYTIFAFVIVRQVNLMSQTLITPISSIIKAISLFNFGFSLGLIVLVVGLL